MIVFFFHLALNLAFWFPPNYGVAEIGRNLENHREGIVVLLFDTFSCQGYKRESGTTQNDCRFPGI